MTQAYDRMGNRTGFRLTKGGTAEPEISLYYEYDDLDRLSRVRKNSSHGMVMAEYYYDMRGNRMKLTYPQTGMESRYTYNPGNRIETLQHWNRGVMQSGWVYRYDISGNLITKTSHGGLGSVTSTYRYDSLGRIREEDHSGWKQVLYSYDRYSNRSRMLVAGKIKAEPVCVTDYTYSPDNRLEKEVRKEGKHTETWRYCYDDNGNETFRIWEKRGPRPEYPGSVQLSGSWKERRPVAYERREYNGFHQLLRIHQDEQVVSYQYRGNGLRHSRTLRKLQDTQDRISQYHWDGMNLVAEQTGEEGMKRYLRGGSLIARETDHGRNYYVTNEHGDVAELRNESGTCKVLYEYDAFGKEKLPYEEDDNPFRYCGEYLDLSSDTYYLRARDYRPATGRFVTADPIRDGLNWYTYCENNPQEFVDPTGCRKEVQDLFYDQLYNSANRVANDYWNGAKANIYDFADVLLDVVEVEVEVGEGCNAEMKILGGELGVGGKVYKTWNVADVVFPKDDYEPAIHQEQYGITAKFTNKFELEPKIENGKFDPGIKYENLNVGKDWKMTLAGGAVYPNINSGWGPGGGVTVQLNLTKAGTHANNLIDKILEK